MRYHDDNLDEAVREERSFELKRPPVQSDVGIRDDAKLGVWTTQEVIVHMLARCDLHQHNVHCLDEAMDELAESWDVKGVKQPFLTHPAQIWAVLSIADEFAKYGRLGGLHDVLRQAMSQLPREDDEFGQ